jgi:hypothetical protein
MNFVIGCPKLNCSCYIDFGNMFAAALNLMRDIQECSYLSDTSVCGKSGLDIIDNA